MEDRWSLEGGDEKLVTSNVKEEILTIEAPSQTDINNLIEEKKVSLFSKYFGFSKPKSNEIKLQNKPEIKYKPYRVTEGLYTVTYLRQVNHTLQLEKDVESVMIDGKEFVVNKDALKVSGLLGKLGSGISVGGSGINLSFGPLENLIKDKASDTLGDKDFKLTEKRTIEIPKILERCLHSFHDVFCFDASSANPILSNDIWKEIKNSKPRLKNGRPKGFKEVLSEKKAVEEVNKKLVREPDDSKRILNQNFSIIRSQIYFVPMIHCKLMYKGSPKELVINGLTLEEEKN